MDNFGRKLDLIGHIGMRPLPLVEFDVRTACPDALNAMKLRGRAAFPVFGSKLLRGLAPMQAIEQPPLGDPCCAISQVAGL